MRGDNMSENSKQDEELNTYRIPLNFQIDAAPFGFIIKWRRLGESLGIGLLSLVVTVLLLNSIGIKGLTNLLAGAIIAIIGFAISMNGINGVSLIEYILRISHFLRTKTFGVYGKPDEDYLEKYEKALMKEREKYQRKSEKEHREIDSLLTMIQGENLQGQSAKEIKKAVKLEAKRKKREQKIKKEMIRNGEDPVKVAAIYIPLDKKEKVDEKEYPLYRVYNIVKKKVENIKNKKQTADQRIYDGFEIPAPFTTVVDFMPIDKIQNGIIVTKSHDFVKIMELNPVKFDIKSNAEKNRIINEFIKFLKISPKTLHIKSINTKADLSTLIKDVEEIMEKETNPKCRELQKDEIEYLKAITESSISHRYYIIYKIDNVARNADAELKAINQLYNDYAAAKRYLKKADIDFLEPMQNHSENLLYYLYCIILKDRPLTYHENKLKVAQKYLKAVKNAELLQHVPISEFVSPTEINFRKHKYVVVDGVYKAFFYIAGDGYSELVYPGWITNFTNFDDRTDVDIFARRENKNIIRPKIKMTLANNKRSLNESDDTDTSYDTRLKTLSSTYYIKSNLANEGFYYVDVLITLNADSAGSILAKIREFKNEIKSEEMKVHGCEFIEDIAYLSTLPLNSLDTKWIGNNSRRNVLTSGLASFFPFISNEVSDSKGIYLGNNEEDGTVVLLDLFNRLIYYNANVSILGGSGSGKTFLIQTIALRYRKKQIPTYVITPLKGFEWRRACNEVGGAFIELSETSEHHVNIMDIRMRDTTADALIDGITESKSALVAKISSLKTFFSLLVKNLPADKRDNLSSDLDLVLSKVYKEKGITHDNNSLFNKNAEYKEMPILEDVYHEGSKPEYKYLTPLLQQLKKFVYGSCKAFNHHTNVDLDNPYTVFDVSSVSQDLLPIVMFIATEFTWGRVKENRMQDKIVVIDEVWKLISANETVADYVLELYKTIRGYGGGVICATQDLEDFATLENGKYGKRILSNSCIKIIMKVENENAKNISHLFSLSDDDFKKIQKLERGHGMLIANNDKITIDIQASVKEEMLITTDANKLAQYYANKEKKKQIAG